MGAGQGGTGAWSRLARRAGSGDVGQGTVQRVRDMCPTQKSDTMIGIRRKKYRKWIEATFKEIMAKDFRILKKNLCPQIEAQGN